MLHITFANRLETLRSALLDNLAQAPVSPFAAEQVIVPSGALRRHLTLAMADRFGICAQVEFSFLAQWLWRQMARVLPGVAADSPFASPALGWRVFQCFDDPALSAEHPRLAGYLTQADAVSRYELACRVAGLLEQYLTYRPAWLAEWAAGQAVALPGANAALQADQAWQAALWRAILGQLGVDQEHPGSRFLRRLESLGEDAASRFGLPRQVHVFCLPAIPPLYLDLLRRLGSWVDVHLYVLNPCREYWFEIVDRRRLAYLTARSEAAWHETGNRLLASWGRQAQSHIDLLLEVADQARVDDAGFTPAPEPSLLARLQNSILDLTELASCEPPAADDRSIEIHVCHSLTRELEALQDQLLALFAGANPPAPQDILVVTPDLEAAAPLIDAVFANAPRERFIPYAISGLGMSGVNLAARALLDLLALTSSRHGAGAVFALLRQPIVARRFGIAATDLETLQAWMHDSGIRWGLDAAHRGQQGLPELERFSFADGMQRLFLGYALPERVSSPWRGLLPAGNPEGSAAQLLGGFARFVEEITRLHHDFARPRLPAEWMQALDGALDAFLAPDDAEIDDLKTLRAALRELHAQQQRGGIRTPLPLAVVRAGLTDLLNDPARGGVPTGVVTFTSISSLRHLPYRVVCGIGLNDGAFPSASRPLEFDLMAAAPQRGDRQRRLDERNLFLDLILAARDRLLLSYTGRSIRDNAPLPASVLVSELLENLIPAVAADASAAAREAARRRLVLEHPLQPFSLRYFAADADPRLRSGNRELCEALRLGRTETPSTLPPSLPQAAEEEDRAQEPALRFFTAPLALPGEEWRVVELDRLIRFFGNPSAYLLRERLGIELARPGDDLAEEEPFLPDFPARQALAERLLASAQAGLTGDELLALAQAGIESPPGALGEQWLNAELATLHDFARRYAAATREPCLPPHSQTLEFDLEGERWQLSGVLADLRPGGLVRQRYDDARPRDYLAAWLNHLWLCSAGIPETARETRWITRAGEFRLRCCTTPYALLHELLRLYRQGLQEPLHFFPKTAWKYLEKQGNLNQARSAWESSLDLAWGEADHPAHRLALRGAGDPLDAAFIACAQTVFGPLRAHLLEPVT